MSNDLSCENKNKTLSWDESELNAYDNQTIYEEERNYSYYGLNSYHAKYREPECSICILGYGAADGLELKYWAPKAKRICIVDGTKKYRREKLGRLS